MTFSFLRPPSTAGHPGRAETPRARQTQPGRARLGAVFGCVMLAGMAQATPTTVRENVESSINTGEETDYGFRNGSVVVAPIPFSNPTIGSGLVLGGGYLFTLDPGSKPSVVGIAALGSDNGSKAYGFSVNLYFDNNRWLFESTFAEADTRYDLFTPLGALPLRQDGILGRLSLSYGVTPELSFGGTLRYLNTNVHLDLPGLPPAPPPYDKLLSTELLNIGVVSKWDRRDDTLYPTRGSLLDFQASRGTALDDSLPDYSKGYVNYAHYFPMGDTGVLATQISTCAASSDTPFFDQCSLGGTDSFRGFSFTQFLDLRSASLQVEYRHEFSNRVRGAAFAGVGWVGPNYDKFDIGGPHSAAGLGLRYRVSKKFPVDLAVDVARNNLKENIVYIYVGQRF